MALTAIVDSLDSVPEGLRDHYEERDGKFALKVDGVEHLTPEGDKAQVLADLAKERRARQKLAKDLEALGDPAEIASMRDRLAKLEEEEASAQGDYTKALEARDARHQKEVEALTGQLGSVAKQLRRVLKQDAAVLAITKHDGIPAALQKHVEDHMDFVEEGDGLRVVVRGLDGAEIDSAEALVEQMSKHDDWRWGFKPNGASGGGAGGRRAGGANGIGGIGPDTVLTPEQTAAYIREHGKDAYLAARGLPTGT